MNKRTPHRSVDLVWGLSSAKSGEAEPSGTNLSDELPTLSCRLLKLSPPRLLLEPAGETEGDERSSATSAIKALSFLEGWATL
jgi:hypothetical protein